MGSLGHAWPLKGERQPTALTSTSAIQARRFLLDVLEDLGPNERWKRRRS